MAQMPRVFPIFAYHLVQQTSLWDVGVANFYYVSTSDISLLHTAYCLDDTSSDTSLNNFKINNVPSYLFAIIQDILSINSMLKVHVLPWSPVCYIIFTSLRLNLRCTKPGWMKDGGTMNSGSLMTGNVDTCKYCILFTKQTPVEPR